jgi:uncharacterized protein with PQ loop repeat
MTTFALFSQITAYIALAFWTFPVIPQIIKNARSHSTSGLSIYMYGLNIVSATLFAAFAIQSGLPLPSIVQPHLFSVSCIVVIAQILHYDVKHTLVRTSLLVGCVTLVTVALELTGFYLLASASSSLVSTLYGVLCCIVAFVGYIPQIKKTYTTKDASAISVVFLGLTMAGGVLFLVSLMFAALDESTFNWQAALTYVNVTAGAAILAVLYVRYRKRRGDIEWKQSVEEASELNDTSSQVTQIEDSVSLFVVDDKQ